VPLLLPRLWLLSLLWPLPLLWLLLSLWLLPRLVLLSLQVSAVILSAAKDPDEFHSPKPLEPFQPIHPLPLSRLPWLSLTVSIAVKKSASPDFKAQSVAPKGSKDSPTTSPSAS
jgi:hypothetical protein